LPVIATIELIEDGPESAEGRYEYGDKVYRLEERESETWSVFGGPRLIGTLITTPAVDERSPLYTVRLDHEA
jgi:hypothetical protein